MMRECRASILEELLAMGGGRFVPYHKTAMAVAAVVAFVFSLIFRQTAVFEAPIAVIDLDASRYSTELIEHPRDGGVPHALFRGTSHGARSQLRRALPTAGT